MAMNEDGKMENFPAYFVDTTCTFLKNPLHCDAVDWVICTKQGYLLEIKNSRICSSCQVHVKDVVDLATYYSFQHGHCQCYYILRGAMGNFVVVLKDKRLTVVKQLAGVLSFKIGDIENIGQPQLEIVESPTCDPKVILLNGTCDESSAVCEENENASVVQCIPVALQDMKNQLDVLKTELRTKQGLINQHLDQHNAGPIEDCVIVQGPSVTPLMDLPVVSQPLMLTESWQRVYSSMWVAAVQLVNTSNRVVEKLKVSAKGFERWKYRWAVLTPGDSLAPLTSSSINPHSTATVVCKSHLLKVVGKTTWTLVACHLPADSTSRGTLSCRYELRYQDHIIDSPEFRISMKQLVGGRWDLFRDIEERSSVKDVICMRLTHTFCDLELFFPVTPAVTLLEILTCELRLEAIPQLAGLGGTSEAEVYLRGRTSALSGLLLFVRSTDIRSHSIKVIGRDSEQLLLFVSAMRQVVPYGTRLEVHCG